MEIWHVVSIIAPIVVAAAAFGGMKVGLNGTRQRVEKLELSQEELKEKATRTETKVDMILEKL